MEKELKDYLTQALTEYTQGEYFNTLVQAKEQYFSLTGSLSDDDDNFEEKMNCFNDWYLFHYRFNQNDETFITSFFKNNTGGEEKKHIADAVGTVTHSLFEFSKRSFRKQIVLKDLLHNEKIVLARDHSTIGIIENDLFIGRIITCNDQSYLLNGLCIFPQETRSILSKQSKKVRKLNDSDEEHLFLLHLEQLKTKWLRYNHVDLNKIFVF